jgi:hypothetical protein
MELIIAIIEKLIFLNLKIIQLAVLIERNNLECLGMMLRSEFLGSQLLIYPGILYSSGIM